MARLSFGFVASWLMFVWTNPVFAQNSDKKPGQTWFPSPLKMEFAQHLNPWNNQHKIAVDAFRLGASFKTTSVQYSSLAPTGVAGKQFQAIPGGYKIVEFTAKPKWGALQGFRSTGYSSRLLSPGVARDLTGAAMEFPNLLWRTSLTGYVVHAAPASNQAPAYAGSGSQAGITWSRDFSKKASLATEWTQSWQESADRGAPRPGRGLFARFRATAAGAEATFTVRMQGQGLTNPAMPSLGRARSLAAVDVHRAYKGHQIQYTRQTDTLGRVFAQQVPSIHTQFDSIGWKYGRKRWPQFSASRTWSAQSMFGSRQSEQNTRVSASKAFKQAAFTLAYVISEHNDELARRLLWRKAGLAGDASFGLPANSRWSIHYETNSLVLPFTSAQLIHSDVLQSGTRISLWNDRFSFSPAVNVHRQWDCAIKGVSYMAGVLLSAMIRLPASLFGGAAELLVSFSSQRNRTYGHPGQGSTGLVVQWNVKRL